MLAYKLKKLVVGTSLLALGTAFEIISKCENDLRDEIADWDEGFTFSLGVMPKGPAVALKKEGDRIRYMGARADNPTARILFKNMDCAIMPLTGMMSADIAFVQRRAVLYGSVSAAMAISRAMAIVQRYLMPGFMFGRLFKRPPRLTWRQYLLKAWVLTALLPAMAVNLVKQRMKANT